MILFQNKTKQNTHSFAFWIVHNNFITTFSLGKQHIQMIAWVLFVYAFIFFLIILLEIPIKHMSEIQSCIMVSVVKQHRSPTQYSKAFHWCNSVYRAFLGLTNCSHQVDARLRMDFQKIWTVQYTKWVWPTIKQKKKKKSVLGLQQVHLIIHLLVYIRKEASNFSPTPVLMHMA